MKKKKTVSARVVGGPALGDAIILADTPISRMRGLLGTDELREGEGCLLVPCSRIHCKGMAYPIDAVYLSAPGEDLVREVLAVETVAPGETGMKAKGAKAVLELPAGAAAAAGLSAGSKVSYERVEGSAA